MGLALFFSGPGLYEGLNSILLILVVLTAIWSMMNTKRALTLGLCQNTHSDRDAAWPLNAEPGR